MAQGPSSLPARQQGLGIPEVRPISVARRCMAAHDEGETGNTGRNSRGDEVLFGSLSCVWTWFRERGIGPKVHLVDAPIGRTGQQSHYGCCFVTILCNLISSDISPPHPQPNILSSITKFAGGAIPPTGSHFTGFRL